MKIFAFTLLLLVADKSWSQDLQIKNYNAHMTDVKSVGQTKESLFKSLNRKLVKLGDAICANRAQVWTYDLKRFFEVDSAKIFLFYTKKNEGSVGRKVWWYHVSPVVAEDGKAWVIDGGFPGMIKTPLEPKDWLKKFTGSENCKEIQAEEKDLLKLMFYGQVFPKETNYGRYDCYHITVPAGYWWPSSIAKSLLGEDEKGKPVNYSRDSHNLDEVYSACLEAATGPIGGWLGTAEKKCKEYLDI